jgi:ATP-binding cassette subfamily C (CFTR/MRP) protein 1
VLWTLSTELSKASVPAASLSFLASLLLLGLSHLEHLRAVRPSMLINVYLLFTLLFDIAKVRTLWLNDATTHLAAVYSSSIGIKLLTLITEAFEKRDILLDRFMHPSPEVTSGIYNLSTFGWLSSLLRLGSSQNLLMSDLYPVDDDMKTVRHQ